jgi:small subunit ribosomal protein S4e
MVKNHLKTIATPKSWPIHRKSRKYVMRQNSGPHNMKESITLNMLLIDILGLAKTKKEAVYILHHKEVLVDGKRRKEVAFPIGMFDVISIKDIKKDYRLLIDSKGKFKVMEIDPKEAMIKPIKIIGKRPIGKKMQINLSDGKNLLVQDDNFRVDDTIIYDFNKKQIKKHLNLEKGKCIFLINGKHRGDIGKIEDVEQDKIIYKIGQNEVFDTIKKYAFLLGDDKPEIKVKE